MRDAHLGSGVIINTGAVVEHDCAVGGYAHIAPNTVLGGSTRVASFSLVGLGAAVLPGVSVGSRTIIGAGGVAARDIADHVVAMGVPSRVLKRVCSKLSA